MHHHVTRLALLAVTLLGTIACGSTTTAAPDTRCDNAVAAVQTYKAPGQQQTILEQVIYHMAAERRPTKIDGWEPADRTGPACLVTFRAVIGNESQRFQWTYTPTTGRVEATDAKTKTLSSW